MYTSCGNIRTYKNTCLTLHNNIITEINKNKDPNEMYSNKSESFKKRNELQAEEKLI